MRFKKYTYDWSKYCCSDFLKAYSTNSLSWDKLSYEDSDGVLNLHYGLIHNGAPTLIDTASYNLPKIIEDMPKSYELCKNGDVIFADASEDTNDICKPVEICKTNGKPIVSGLHTIHTRDYKDLTCVGFKGYLFSSKSFHKQVFRLTQGTKIFSINFSNFREMRVSIPRKEEQLKIVDFLSIIDDRISTQSKIIEDLELVKKGIYNHIFTQLNSVEKILLEDLLIDFNKRTLTDKQYPILSSTLSGIYLQEEYFNKQAASATTEGYKIVPYGFATYRSMSDTGEFRFNLQTIVENGIVSPAYPVFTCIENCRLDFILFCLNYYDDIKKQLFSMKQGGTRLALHFNSLCKLYIPRINKEKQSKIMAIVNSYDAKIVTEKQILEKLKEQKKFLLSNMFI